MRANKINVAILQCLEHVATCTSPPGAGAADFLLRLLDHDVFSVDEMEEITIKVSAIISGILERGALSGGQFGNAGGNGNCSAHKPTDHRLQLASRPAGGA